MKAKSIGIVGGAGPLAGVLLLKQVINLSAKLYGCVKDADFPEIFLINFPFSEMLTPEMDYLQVQKELSQCLNQLRKNGASVLAIACNTLHAFLDEATDAADLIHLPQAIASEISISETPLVLCTSTSRNLGVHKRFFPCLYPDSYTQLKIDRTIDLILRGTESQTIVQTLLEIIQEQESKTIILGCTELSLFRNEIQFENKSIIDPLEILANKTVEASFSKTKGDNNDNF